MAENRIEFEDIFSPSLKSELEDLNAVIGTISKNLEGLGDAVKAEASKMKEMINNSNLSADALERLVKEVELLAEVEKRLGVAKKEHEKATREVEKTQEEYRKKQIMYAELWKKLDDEEEKRKEQIERKAAQRTKRAQADAAKAINDANKKAKAEAEAKRQEEARLNTLKLLHGEIKATSLSYNQLTAMYSQMSAKLKGMSQDEIQATAENRKFAAATLDVRNQMNEAQKAMGNFSLQVGKYKAAFDGLGFSLQQIIREAPSATNWNQFFLAISNNIPLFADQIVRVKKEIPQVKKELMDLEKQKSVWEDMMNAADATAEMIEEAAGNVDILKGRIKNLQGSTSVWKAIASSIFSWQTALLGVVFVLSKYGGKMIEWVKNLGKGFKDIANYITLAQSKGKLFAKVLESVAKNTVELNLINDKIQNIASGTTEWKNAIKRVNELTGSTLDSTKATVDAVRKVTEEYKKQAMQIAINNQIVESQAADFVNRQKRNRIYNGNLSAEEVISTLGITDEKQIDEITDAYNKRRNAINYVDALRLQQRNKPIEGVDYDSLIRTGEKSVSRSRDSFFATINKYTPINSQATNDWLNSLYKAVPNSNRKDSRSKDESYATRQYEINRRLLEMQEESFRQEMDLAYNSYEEKKAQENAFYESEKERLKGHNEELEALEREHESMMRVIEQEHLKDKQDIEDKYAKKAIELQIEQSKATLKETNIRVRTIKDEQRKNEVVIDNLTSLEQQLAALRAIDTQNFVDEEEKKQKAIEETLGLIEKERNKIGWSKQLSLPKNLGDVVGIRDAFTDKMGGKSEGILRNALGDKQYEAMSEQQRESAFDTWIENSLDAMGTWYSTTVEYIGGVLDAYVELQQKKIEVAQEATDAAKDQYEKEKALMEAGYANNMDKAYAEYQEKKALQEQAEKDAEKANQAKMALDSMSQMSSLITAAAQMWQTVGAIPVVGKALAISSILAMFASFAGAKAMAAKVTKYGDGTAQLIDYGGSHASGNDVPLGYDRNGNEERIERGEIKGVINRRAVRKYGANRIIDLIDSMNRLSYVDDAVSASNRNSTLVLRSEKVDVNLSRIEESLARIEKHGEESRIYGDGVEIVKNGNYTKRIRRI